MKPIEVPALFGFEEDIRNRTWLDWLRAHTSFLKPLHGYDGKLRLENDYLIFNGIKAKTGEPFEYIIDRNEIVKVYYGFDEVFSVFEVRNLGLIWMPLRLTVNKEGKDIFVYLIINFRLGFCDNKHWFQLLQKWLSHQI